MNLTNILPMLAPLLAGPPLTALLYKNLGTLSPPTKWLLLAFCVGILIAGTTFLAHYWPHVGRSVKYLTSGAALVTMTLSWQSGNLFPGPSDVTIRYSDGSVSPSQPPNTVTVWGRQHRAWTLHPPYGSDRMADQLEARFLDRPSRVKVWVSKPSPTLLMPDGTPTNSDGISLELAAIDHWGHVAKRKTVNISQRNFLERRWISKNLSFDSGISRIAIRVTAGPPGSTPYNDATLVALQSHSTGAYLSAVGDLFLRGLAVAVVLLGLPALLFRKAGGCSLRQAASFVSTARAALPVFLLVLVVGAIAYCHAIQSDVIYYWDLRNYWAQTEHLYEVLKESGWRDALLLIASTYSAEYSMLPALLPALLSLVIGYPTHLSFSVMMAVIYAAPAFLMTSYLGWRCFTTAAVDRHPGSAKLSIAALAPLLAIPAFLAGALVNRPDIGGVILAGAASILAVRLTVLIAGHGMPANIWPPHPRLVRTSLALATLLSAMFLFRRWYMFTAVGIVLTVTLFVAYDVWRAQQGRLGVLVRAATSACLVAMGILSLVAWVMFDWARDLDAHDYLDLYSAYRLSLLTTLKLMVQALGVLVPATALGAVWVRLRHAGDRRLLVLLCGTTAVSALLFLQISSPGLHHYYLLMPLLGAGTVGAALMLVRWNKRLATICFLCFLGLSVSAPLNVEYGGAGYGGITRVLTPGYQSWLPRHQAGKAALVDLGNWLTSTEMKSTRFCVLASSFKINTPILEELWQIAPSLPKHAFDGRIIQLGDVDTVHGPPWPSLKECEVVLVGSPPQTHLPGRQFSVVVPATDLLGNEGIGAAFERLPQAFALDEDTAILAFRRTREITEEEFGDLITRVQRRRAQLLW